MFLQSCGTALKGRRQYFVKDIKMLKGIATGSIFINFGLATVVFTDRLFKNKKENKDER